MRVLVVEDNKKMAGLLKKGLEERDHSVSLALDGQAGLDLATGSEFDSIVLDLMLPKINGFEVVRQLRKSNERVPIVVLSAKDATTDIVRALDLGADDYLTKPFSFAELLARLRVLIQRGSHPRPTLLRVEDLVLNPATSQVLRGSREIRLSRREYRLLECLMRHAGRIVPRHVLVDRVWNCEQDVEENTLDECIFALRNKIDKDFKLKLIQTIRGIGYFVRGEADS
jgi:DNA-binding response OmpR family regulator